MAQSTTIIYSIVYGHNSRVMVKSSKRQTQAVSVDEPDRNVNLYKLEVVVVASALDDM